MWGPRTDRATRAPHTEPPPGGVLLLDGPFLLGHGFPLAPAVHPRLSRPTPGPPHTHPRTVDAARLPAVRGGAATGRETADILVHTDDVQRPAWTG
jgi:hypothetical protein